ALLGSDGNAASVTERRRNRGDLALAGQAEYARVEPLAADEAAGRVDDIQQAVPDECDTLPHGASFALKARKSLSARGMRGGCNGKEAESQGQTVGLEFDERDDRFHVAGDAAERQEGDGDGIQAGQEGERNGVAKRPIVAFASGGLAPGERSVQRARHQLLERGTD